MPAYSAIYNRVAAPAVAPHRYGLFSVATPTNPDVRWEAGVAWRSQACATVSPYLDACIAGAAAVPKTLNNLCPPDIEVNPFAVYASAKRSSTDLEDAETEAKLALQLGEEFAAEQRLWVQLTAVAPQATGGTPLRTLGYIEQHLGQGYHGEGVIHMNRLTATLLTEALEPDGDIMRTRIGTPVVVGAGYGPTTALGAMPTEAAIYGTGALAVHRATDPDIYSTYDRNVNDALVIAERPYLVAWDCAIIGRLATV